MHAKIAKFYSLLFTLALERSQLTRDGERRGGVMLWTFGV